MRIFYTRVILKSKPNLKRRKHNEKKKNISRRSSGLRFARSWRRLCCTSATLNIEGEAKTSSTDAKVYFSKAEIKEGDQSPAGSATPGVAGTDVKAVTFTASGLKQAGDKVTATYTIQNDSNYPVKLTLTTTELGSDFTLATSFVETTLTPKDTESAEDEYTFTVTVTLAKTPTTIAEVKSSFKLTIEATGQ